MLTIAGVIAVLLSASARLRLRRIAGRAGIDIRLPAADLMAVSRHSLLKATIPASVETVTAAVLLAIYSGATAFILEDPMLREYLYRPEEVPLQVPGFIPEISSFSLLSVHLCAAVRLFLVVIDHPWRSSLGVSALDFLRGFIGHIAEGTRELEEFFEESAKKPSSQSPCCRSAGRTARESPVRPADDSPGPMGEIGGGNFPERVASRSDGLAFPPHATAGHDFNLVTEREVDKILSTAETATRTSIRQPSDGRTPGHRGRGHADGTGVGSDALVVNRTRRAVPTTWSTPWDSRDVGSAGRRARRRASSRRTQLQRRARRRRPRPRRSRQSAVLRYASRRWTAWKPAHRRRNWPTPLWRRLDETPWTPEEVRPAG